MSVLGLAAVVWVAGCDKTVTGSPEQPQARPTASAAEQTKRLDGPPAALRREMKTCARPDSRGEIEYGVRVSPAGNVVFATALQSTAPPQLHNCTLQRLRAWPFPAGSSEVAFRFSMSFGSEGKPAKQADKNRLKRSVKERTSHLQHCYNKGLRTDPTITGKLSYLVVIERSGSVSRVIIEENTGLPGQVVDCTVEAIESWTLPMDGATEGTDVRFSVVFSGS